MRTTPAALAFVLAAASVTTPAWSQVDPVEGEYARAQLLRASQPDEALAVYRQLHERTRAPRALVQIGQLEAQLGRWVRADEHLTAALAVTGDAWLEARRPAVTANLDEVRRHVSEFTVVANVPGARVRLNGEDVGTLPLARAPRVAVGQVVIDVDAEGYEHLRETAQATPGRSRVEVSLVARRVVAAVVLPPATQGVAVAPTVGPRSATTTGAAGNATLRTVGVVGMIGGGIGLGLGVVGLALRNGRVGAFSEQGCWLEGGSAVMGGGQCQAEYDAGGTMGALSVAGFVGGGVLAAAGVTLWLVGRGGGGGGERGERRAIVACGVGPGTVGVSCGGVW